jgi:23S rRNA pseudouridine955/2504/2580 synthase
MEYKGTMELRAAENDDQRRLDRLLRRALGALPLSAIHRLLRTGKVRINGKRASGEDRVRAGDTITVENMRNSTAEDRSGKGGFHAGSGGSGFHAGVGLPILYEGGGLLILNKPSGAPVHGRNSLDSRVKSYLEAKLPPSLSFSPGPLHRLDVPTSGILVFSASLNGAREFTRLLREGKLRKYYLAVVQGEINGSETWEDMLTRDSKSHTSAVIQDSESSGDGENRPKAAVKAGAKAALTLVIPLMTRGDLSVLLLEIRTGRTHQIRIQAASRGHPLWGDAKYGGARCDGGILLHALLLVFPEQEGVPGFPAHCFAPPPRRFLESAKKNFHCSKDKFFALITEKTGVKVYTYDCEEALEKRPYGVDSVC